MPPEAPEDAPPQTSLQKQASWWAVFVTKYGITTILAAVLLAVVLGFLESPTFTGAKAIENETRDSTTRIEATLATLLMRQETAQTQIVGMRKSLESLSCVTLLSPAQRQKITTRDQFEAQCGWIRATDPEAGEAPP